MKILCLSGITSDYLNSVIIHGGRSLLGSDFVDYKKSPINYNNYGNSLNDYGRGFTIYKLLNDIEILT